MLRKLTNCSTRELRSAWNKPLCQYQTIVPLPFSAANPNTTPLPAHTANFSTSAGRLPTPAAAKTSADRSVVTPTSVGLRWTFLRTDISQVKCCCFQTNYVVCHTVGGQASLLRQLLITCEYELLTCVYVHKSSFAWVSTICCSLVPRPPVTSGNETPRARARNERRKWCVFPQFSRPHTKKALLVYHLLSWLFLCS